MSGTSLLPSAQHAGYGVSWLLRSPSSDEAV